MVDSRCGPCTLCCKLVGTHELSKPPNVWCQHCEIGVGCKIHETRPQGCRDFECLFYQNPQMPEELRPSNCKVVFEVFQPNVILALCDPTRSDAWKNPAVMKVIRTLAASGKAVIVTTNQDGTKPVFFLPESKKADDVIREMHDELSRRFQANATA